MSSVTVVRSGQKALAAQIAKEAPLKHANQLVQLGGYAELEKTFAQTAAGAMTSVGRLFMADVSAQDQSDIDRLTSAFQQLTGPERVQERLDVH